MSIMKIIILSDRCLLYQNKHLSFSMGKYLKIDILNKNKVYLNFVVSSYHMVHLMMHKMLK